MQESAPPPTDPIYSGEVPVVLKHPEREDRHTSLTCEMVYGTTQPRNQKVLQIQLTDESDSYLLYTLDISEDDFHSIKTEQSILVDFPTFPSKIVELLRQCQAAAVSEDHPRFVASLSTLCGTPMFTITESNPFRQLAHLSLRFVAGNDAAIKKHLAARLADFKAELATVSDDLAQRTRQLQETASLAAEQSEKLRTLDEEHARALGEAQMRQAEALAESREQSISAQQTQARLTEQERQRLLERHDAELGAARGAQQAAEAQASQLTTKQHDMQMQLRERDSRLQAAEHELQLLRQEAASLRQENSELTTKSYQQEKELSAKDVELSALGQSVADKESLLAKTSSLLEAANDAKQQHGEAAAYHKDSVAKLQLKLRASAAEITKGNQIISKLQADAQQLRGKLKLKAAVQQQAQEQAAQQDAALNAAERGAAELRAQLAEAGAERERSDEACAAAKRQLAEAQELLRSNQQVIQWLNKELNDAQTSHRVYTPPSTSFGATPPAAMTGGTASRVSSIRPTAPLPLAPASSVTVNSSVATSSSGGAAGGGSITAGMSELRSKAGQAFRDGGAAPRSTTAA